MINQFPLLTFKNTLKVNCRNRFHDERIVTEFENSGGSRKGVELRKRYRNLDILLKFMFCRHFIHIIGFCLFLNYNSFSYHFLNLNSFPDNCIKI